MKFSYVRAPSIARISLSRHPVLMDRKAYEVVRGTGPDGAFVELWDRSLAPGGLALEALANEEGVVAVTGYQVPIPFNVVQDFLNEVKSYLASDPPSTYRPLFTHRGP